MYIASTENYPGAFEKDTILDIIKAAGNTIWNLGEITEVYQIIDDVEVYLPESEIKLINEKVKDIQTMIADNVRDTEFYNQETARLIYDRI